MLVHRKVHRYVGRRHGGHRQVASSLELPPEDERVLGQRTDLAGDDPGVPVPAYLTFFALPASGLVAFARTTYDAEADRTGAVRTETLLAEPRELPGVDPFPLASLFGPAPRDELALARERDRPLELEPVRFDAAPEPAPEELLAALATLGEERLAWLLAALEGALPVAVLGAPDPEATARALLRLVPERGRAEHALCTGALAPRAFARLAFAPDLARGAFLARAARERDLALVDFARGQMTNVAATDLGARLARSIVAGGARAILGMVERASCVAAYRAFSDVALQLRWEELAHAPARTAEESVELANHLRHRGAPAREVVACYRAVLDRPPAGRTAWTANVVARGFLPVRLELADEPVTDAEAASVVALVRAAAAEGHWEPVLALLERGGDRLFPEALEAALDVACAAPDEAAAPLLAWVVTHHGRGRAAVALGELATRAPIDALLARAVDALDAVPAAERADAAAALARGALARGTFAAQAAGLLGRGDEPALAVLRSIAARVRAGAPPEVLAPVVQKLAPARPELVEALVRLVEGREPRATGDAEASGSETGTFAVPEVADDAERTGALERPSHHESDARARTGAFARLESDAERTGAFAPVRRTRAPDETALAALAVIARELIPRLADRAALAAHARTLAALARAGRHGSRPELARAGRARAVALAASAGDRGAIARRCERRARAGALDEAAWLASTLDAPALEPIGPAVARALVAALAADPHDPDARAAAPVLGRALAPSAWAGLALEELLRLDAGVLPAREALLARAAFGTIESPEAVLAALAQDRAAAAPPLARALAGRPGGARWLELAVAVATSLGAGSDELELLGRAAARTLREVAATGPHLVLAAELLRLAGGRELRAESVRFAVRVLELAREDALALLARELPGVRDPDLEREVTSRLGALLAEGRVDAGDLARLGASVLRAALARVTGSFNLKLQSGLERLAVATNDKATLVVALESLLATGDVELGRRVAARVRERAAWAQDPDARELATALESGRRKR